MSNYKNGKTKELRHEQKRAIERRTTAKHETVEQMFGAGYPKFGASLGTSFDGVNGVISKVNRARSISASITAPAVGPTDLTASEE